MSKIVIKGKMVSFEEGIIINNELWYVAVPQAWLCKMSLSDYQSQMVCQIPFVDAKETYYSYNVVAAYNSKIVLMPKYANNILVYHTKSGEFNKIELKKSLLTSGTEAGAAIKFRSYAIDGNVLWMMPQSCHCIIEYNLLTSVLTEHDDWYKQFEDYNWINVNLFGKGILAEEALWIPCYQLNAILEFSIKTKKAQLHFIGDKMNFYSAIVYDNGEFWILDNVNNLLCKWDKDSRKITNCISLPDGDGMEVDSDERRKYKAVCMYMTKEKIVLVPALAHQFLLVDTQSNKVQSLLRKENGESFVGVCVLDENRIICSAQDSEHLVTIFFEEGKAESAVLSMGVEAEQWYMNGVFPEAIVDLKRTFKTMEEWEVVRQLSGHCDVGTRIYKELI